MGWGSGIRLQVHVIGVSLDDYGRSYYGPFMDGLSLLWTLRYKYIFNLFDSGWRKGLLRLIFYLFIYSADGIEIILASLGPFHRCFTILI